MLWSFHSPFHSREGEPDVPALVNSLKPGQLVCARIACACAVQMTSCAGKVPCALFGCAHHCARTRCYPGLQQ